VRATLCLSRTASGAWIAEDEWKGAVVGCVGAPGRRGVGRLRDGGRVKVGLAGVCAVPATGMIVRRQTPPVIPTVRSLTVVALSCGADERTVIRAPCSTSLAKRSAVGKGRRERELCNSHLDGRFRLVRIVWFR